MSNFFPPNVTALNKDVEIGSSLSFLSLFEATDLDGNPIVELRYRDNDSLATSGVFRRNGSTQQANVWHTVTASNAGSVRFHGGLVVGNESFSIQVRDYDQATDTYRWSNVDSGVLTTVVANRRPPVLTVTDGDVLETETRTIDDLIEYYDPDGYPALGYWLVDRSANTNGGRFFFNGAYQRSARWFYVPAEQLGDVVYHGARFGTSEMIGVRVTDGGDSSAVSNFRMTTNPNLYRPVITVQDKNAPVGQVVGLRTFISVSDRDGNSIKSFSVNDTGVNANSGFLTYNNQVLAAGQFHSFAWSEINNVKYHFSQRFDTESLAVRVFDGRHLSNLGRGVMKAVTKPIVSFDSDIAIDALAEPTFTSLFTKEDPGPAYTQIQVVDETGVAGIPSGHFELNGNWFQKDTVYSVRNADMNDLIFKGAASWNGRQQDSVVFRTFNGTEYGSWQRMNISTDPVGAPALNSSRAWFAWMGGAKTQITFSFAEQVPSYYAPDADERQGFTPLAASQRAKFRQVFDEFEQYLDVEFNEVPFTLNSSNSVIVIGAANLSDAQGWAYLPAGNGLRSLPGDIWLHTDGPTDPGDPDNSEGGFGKLTMIHELGHALGLKHSFEGTVILPESVENQFYTMMSYSPPAFHNEFPATPMLWDIVELQRLYNFNEDHMIGNDHHFFEESHLQALMDSAGIDTLNYQSHNGPETINLNPGYYSSINGVQNSLLIPYGVQIENARGGGSADTIIGNEVRNLIWGNAGNDHITGRGGNDKLMGGAGGDTYRWNLADGHDTIDELGMGGRDKLEINSPYAIDALEDDFSFLRQGSDLRINLTFDRGRGQGSIIVKNMGQGSSRVETLKFFNKGEQVDMDIDLNSIYIQATDSARRFVRTNQETEFGFIATFA